ncbi:MAG: hypothetical protein IPI14_11370 [Polaromonas sp.]|nr:hypothetical protein [Polaromonas sp.]
MFEALETKLLQGSLTSENAELALIDYAKGLHDISNLEMCGFCEDTDSDTKVTTLFLFARTRGIPHQYYLAKRVNEVWTSWERVEVDIQAII